MKDVACPCNYAPHSGLVGALRDASKPMRATAWALLGDRYWLGTPERRPTSRLLLAGKTGRMVRLVFLAEPTRRAVDWHPRYWRGQQDAACWVRHCRNSGKVSAVSVLVERQPPDTMIASRPKKSAPKTPVDVIETRSTFHSQAKCSRNVHANTGRTSNEYTTLVASILLLPSVSISAFHVAVDRH